MGIHPGGEELEPEGEERGEREAWEQKGGGREGPQPPAAFQVPFSSAGTWMSPPQPGNSVTCHGTLSPKPHTMCGPQFVFSICRVEHPANVNNGQELVSPARTQH